MINYLQFRSCFSLNANKERWKKLGLSQEWFEKDPQAANYLIRSHLIYSIIGFSTQANPSTLGLRITNDGLELLKEGRFVSINQAISPFFQFSQWSPYKGGALIEIANKKKWTYLGTQGLVPIDRWTHAKFLPVCKISPKEQARLLNHAFHQDPKANNRCIIQIITHPRDVLSASNPLTRNYHLYKPMHAYMRIIDEEGNVYSSGFGSIEQEGRFRKKYYHYLSTITGMPTILDFEEFRKHDARVSTSIVISHQQCIALLNKIANLRKNKIRFHIMKQNCNTLIASMMRLIHTDIPLRMSIKEVFIHMCPCSQQIKKLSTWFIHCIDKQPAWIKTSLKTAGRIILFLPNEFLNITINLFLFLLGSNRGSASMASKNIDRDFKYFHSLGSSFFGDHLHQMDYSLRMIEWQLRHPGTYVHSYKGPSMNICPPESQQQRAEDLLLKKKLQRYFGVSQETCQQCTE